MTTHQPTCPGKALLPKVVLGITSIGLVSSLVLAGLVMKGVVAVPWDNPFLILVTIAGLIPFCVSGFLASCLSYFRYRGARSVAAMILGVFATGASVFALVVISVAGLAGHPV